MKKLIGILGVAVIAMAMLFSTNVVNITNGDMDLASLVSMGEANAECPYEWGFNDGRCTWTNRCVWDGETCDPFQ